MALLPDETEGDAEPLPVDTVESSHYASAAIPVSVDESERMPPPYPHRSTPMLAQQSMDMPVSSPVTSYRKRQRQQYYGYPGYQSEDVQQSPIPSPSRRRYALEQPHHAYSFSPPPPPQPSAHRSMHRDASGRPVYYGSFNAPLEPTLPLSHSELRQQSYRQQQTNRPPAISARQSSNASAGSLLGSLFSGANEFDLFNGELIDSDQEEQKRSRTSPRDAF